MRWFLLLLVLLIVAGLVWYLTSRRSAPGAGQVGGSGASSPLDREAAGTTTDPIGATPSGLGASSGLAGAAGLGSAAETNWGGDPTDVPGGRADVSWDKQAQDEDALMRTSGSVGGSSRVDEGDGGVDSGASAVPAAHESGDSADSAPSASQAALGDRLTIDEPETAASVVDSPAGAEAAGGDAGATRGDVPEVDGGTAPLDPIEAERRGLDGSGDSPRGH